MSKSRASKYSHLTACRITSDMVRLAKDGPTQPSQDRGESSFMSLNGLSREVSSIVQRTMAGIAAVPSAAVCGAHIIMDELSLLPHRPPAVPAGTVPAEAATPAP